MAQFERNSNPSWDDGEYITGHTRPPKDHTGLLAFLLIVIIFLSGVVTVLGIMNVRLFRRLNEQEEEAASIEFAAERTEDAAISFAAEPIAEEPLLSVDATEPELRLDLQQSPEALTTEPEAPEAENGTLPQDPEANRMSLQDIYQHCIDSVVSVICTSRGGSSSGTGVVLTEHGYLVTNYHVIEKASEITVQLSDGQMFSAGVVGCDPATDLAVLFIDGAELIPAEFGDSDSLRVGDSVVAIGDPLGVKLRGTMTTGIVSAINRNVGINGRSLNLIQTDAALNSGNSGGPLINCFGQVIGINTMKVGAFADSAGVEGIGFAIPSATVKDIVDQIIAQGYVSGRPSLGITGERISIFYQRYYRLPAGLLVTEVAPGSEAERQGLLSGDILVSLDGREVYSMEELTTMLYNYSAGDKVELVIWRNGETYTAEATLAEARG